MVAVSHLGHRIMLKDRRRKRVMGWLVRNYPNSSWVIFLCNGRPAIYGPMATICEQ